MLPETAPFPADQIVALNRIISRTNAEQRTWLSGFLAGYQAATAPQPAAAAPPARRAPLTILFATESGNAEALADAARKAAGKLGFAARVLDMADATPAQIAGAQNLLVIASTWGEGDPPQRAIDFFAALMADDAPRLEGCATRCWRWAIAPTRSSARPAGCSTSASPRWVRRASPSGSSAIWTTRRRAGLDRRNAWHAAGRVGRAGGRRGHPCRFRAPAPAAAAWSRTRPFEAEITERVRLSGSRSTSDTWHVELSLDGAGIEYEPAIRSGSCRSMIPALVDAVLAATGLADNAPLRTKLLEQFDITTLTAPKFDEYIGGGSRTRQDGWQVIDLLEAAPRKLSEDAASVAAAAAAAALLLDRLQPQGGAGRGASADRGGALCDAWARSATASPRWMWRSGARPATGCVCS